MVTDHVWNWTIPFCTSVRYRMFTSIRCFINVSYYYYIFPGLSVAITIFSVTFMSYYAVFLASAALMKTTLQPKTWRLPSLVMVDFDRLVFFQVQSVLCYALLGSEAKVLQPDRTANAF